MPSYNLSPNLTNRPGPIIAGDPSDKQRDKLLLGTLTEAGQRRDLWLDISGEQVVGILGKRGTGKSYTLGVLIEGLASNSAASPLATHETPRGGLVFDLMDIFWTTNIPLTSDGSEEIRKQYSAMKRGGMKPQALAVEAWIPAGFENPDIDPPGLQTLRLDPSELSLDDWGALFNINVYTEPRGMLIAEVIQRVSESGYMTQSGSEVTAKLPFTLDDLLNCLDGGAFISTYHEATVRAVRQRIQAYAQLEVFKGDATSPTDLIVTGRVSVLMLSRVSDELKQVLVSVLLRRIIRERSTASFAKKRLDLQSGLDAHERERLEKAISERIPRTWVLMDEAHVLAGAGEGSVAKEALIKYAKEGRNFGLSLAVATQQPSALDGRLMSQVETLIVHQLTAPRDAAIATESMKSPRPEEIRVDGVATDLPGLLGRLTQGEAVFSSGNAPNLVRLCVVGIRPRVSAHGGYEA